MCGDLAYKATIGIIKRPKINCCPSKLKPHPINVELSTCNTNTPITLRPYPPQPVSYTHLTLPTKA